MQRGKIVRPREPLKKFSFVVFVVLVVQTGNGYYLNARAHHEDHYDHKVKMCGFQRLPRKSYKGQAIGEFERLTLWG
jgi:hypothetical protein